VTTGTPHWSAQGAIASLSRSVGGVEQDLHGAVVRRFSNGARGVLLIAAFVAAGLASTVAPASAQFGTEDPTATTTPFGDPGATTETTVADPTASTATTAGAADPDANVPGAQEGGGGSADTRTSRRLLAIIGALLGVGFLILILTVLYWRHTRPRRRAAAEPEWVEGEGWVGGPEPEDDQPDPVALQRRLRRRRRRREDRAAEPVGEWFAEPDPTLDPFAAPASPTPDAPQAPPSPPSHAPAPAARRPRARPTPKPPPAEAAPATRPAAPNGQPRRRATAPPGTQPQRVAKKAAPRPAAQRPPATRRRAPQDAPAPTPQPTGRDAARVRRRAPAASPPVAPGAASQAPGQARPRPKRPAPDISDDWDAQTDELAEFWQEMRNKDA
jgi:hypothetical protein